MEDKNLIIDGNEVLVVINGETNEFIEIVVPGCKQIGRSNYKLITKDGKGYVLLKFARKDSNE